MTLQEKFVDFYKDLGMHSIAKLKGIYHTDVVFIDPVGKHTGLAHVEYYFTHLLNTTESCTFTVTQMLSNNNIAMAKWQMVMRHPKIGAGKEIVLDGTSELVIKNDKIIQQTDFYDLGCMIYEHIPLLGNIIRYIKRRMKNQ